MPLAAVAAPLIAGAGVGFGTAFTGARAAKNAAAEQARYGQQGVDLLGRQAQSVVDWINETMKAAASKGEQTAQQAADYARQTFGSAADQVTQAAEGASSEVRQAAQGGAADVRGAAGQANELLRALYERQTGKLAPYLANGEFASTALREGLQPGGPFNREFTAADMPAYDPGFQFRLQQGQQALERSAAARGGALSGGAVKAQTRYAQDYASSEYQNAFSRFRANQSDRYSRLAELARSGQLAASQEGEAGQFYGSRAGSNLLDASRFASDLGFRGAQLASDYGFRGAGLAGSLRGTGAEYSGNALMRGAEYSGDTLMRGTALQGDTAMRGALARAELLAGIGNARASGMIGQANAIQSGISNGIRLASLFQGYGGGRSGGGGSAYDPFSSATPFGYLLGNEDLSRLVGPRSPGETPQIPAPPQSNQPPAAPDRFTNSLRLLNLLFQPAASPAYA